MKEGTILDWNKYTKWMIGFAVTMLGIGSLALLITYGYSTGAIDPYAWLYWKVNAIKGFTENPGYMFLTIHTVLLGIITAWCIKNWRKRS